ncbi:HD domain-containing protein [Thermosipho ferrireducens]|uniref:HD domain-containing protein n=1 Tax=Thermosipho ferrireducens TaxID=2571116 RepID=A0ABX7S5B5_9BACT|nr:HD domain-containing phosphohydrolase [Thermosipho ferrireducens]QTA37714.1 HD domain-containing protein [Thermosipho ferrireducens]
MLKLNNFISIFQKIGHNEYENFVLHSFQVAKISSLIAKELGLNHENVYILGLAHDIGFLLRDLEKDAYHIFLQDNKNIENIIDTFELKRIHPVVSYHLLKQTGLFKEEEVKGILFHHANFSDVNKERLIGSILKLSDMISRKFSLIKSYEDYATILPQTWKKIDNEKVPEYLKKIARELLRNYRLIETLIENDPHFEIFGDFNKKLSMEQAIRFAKIISLIQGTRSFITRNHVFLVSSISQKIGENMLGSFDGKLMKVAGYFHDLGKLKVPLKLLHKKDRLTEEEWLLMKKHVVDTYDILIDSNIEFIADICYAHHERLDGSGYPQKLKGEQMSIYQRILQVADVYAALIENRPYKKALHYKEALDIIKSEVDSGKLDKRIFNELKNIAKAEQNFQSASFKNVIRDIFEEQFETIYRISRSII